MAREFASQATKSFKKKFLNVALFKRNVFHFCVNFNTVYFKFY